MVLQLIDKNTLPIPVGSCIKWIDWIGRYVHTFALSCPNCGHAFSLREHTISDGVVSPSVVCPYGCGFHEFITIKL